MNKLMNTSFQRVNFSGKKEIIYCLNRAAEKAREADSFNANIGKKASNVAEKDCFYHRASGAMEAYLDAAANDSEFEKVAEELAADRNYIKDLKNLLKPVESLYPKYTFYPVDNFVCALEDASSLAGNDINTTNKFLNTLY